MDSAIQRRFDPYMPHLCASSASRAVFEELVGCEGFALSVAELHALLSSHDRLAIADAADQLVAVGLAHRLGSDLYCASLSARSAAVLHS
jgi:hypothetical protein